MQKCPDAITGQFARFVLEARAAQRMTSTTYREILQLVSGLTRIRESLNASAAVARGRNACGSPPHA